jgi:hypothetical protein
LRKILKLLRPAMWCILSGGRCAKGCSIRVAANSHRSNARANHAPVDMLTTPSHKQSASATRNIGQPPTIINHAGQLALQMLTVARAYQRPLTQRLASKRTLH